MLDRRNDTIRTSIRAMRDGFGFSLEEAAEQLVIAPLTLQQWEADDAILPKLRLIEKDRLARLYQMNDAEVDFYFTERAQTPQSYANTYGDMPVASVTIVKKQSPQISVVVAPALPDEETIEVIPPTGISPVIDEVIIPSFSLETTENQRIYQLSCGSVVLQSSIPFLAFTAKERHALDRIMRDLEDLEQDV